MNIEEQFRVDTQDGRCDLYELQESLVTLLRAQGMYDAANVVARRLEGVFDEGNGPEQDVDVGYENACDAIAAIEKALKTGSTAADANEAALKIIEQWEGDE